MNKIILALSITIVVGLFITSKFEQYTLMSREILQSSKKEIKTDTILTRIDNIDSMMHIKQEPDTVIKVVVVNPRVVATPIREEVLHAIREEGTGSSKPKPKDTIKTVKVKEFKIKETLFKKDS